jgi:hypothetical protein
VQQLAQITPSSRTHGRPDNADVLRAIYQSVRKVRQVCDADVVVTLEVDG